MTPDPTPSPTPLEIAEQGVDESVSRFIGRLHEQIRRTEEERDTWRQRAEEAEECIVWVKCDDPEHERLAAAERTVREQREALEAISDFGCDDCGDDETCLDRHPEGPNEWCQTCIALAALAPNTEGEET